MPKKIVFIFLVSVFLLVGCGSAQNNQADNFSGANGTEDNLTSTGADRDQDGEEMKKFYPDNSGATEKNTNTSNSDPGFSVTLELELKMFLADKYNPGVCYGLPGPVPDSSIKSLIAANRGLADFLRSYYGLNDDLDLYNKIKQLNGIRLTEISSSRYQFNFVDGQCCVLKAMEGEISKIGSIISDEVTRTEKQQNPC